MFFQNCIFSKVSAIRLELDWVVVKTGERLRRFSCKLFAAPSCNGRVGLLALEQVLKEFCNLLFGPVVAKLRRAIYTWLAPSLAPPWQISKIGKAFNRP